MRKIQIPERPDLAEKAAEVGFTFATMHGEPYWDETSAYCFTLDQIETDLEAPATELHAMSREAVDRIVASEALMARMGIPAPHMDLIADSWARNEPEIYGRMDLAYDGTGPAKLLEYNADTPTSLYESAAFQWQWLEDQIAAGHLPQGSDQFNGIHEALVERFRDLFAPDTDIHFTAAADNPEDYATVESMAWAAREAGMGAHFSDLAALGVSADGQFLDADSRVIGTLFKLYPWEDLLADDYARHIAGSGCMFLEPAWKAVVSNKGLLPVLWQMFENHPNLLPAFFADDVAPALVDGGRPDPSVAPAFDRVGGPLRRAHVVKPIFSREGAGVTIVEDGEVTEASEARDYDRHARIVQAYHPLPEFDGFRPVIGAWIAGHDCVGIGIREDRARITQDLSRFKPHVIAA
ncbi:glutathionylspermidine synthase family protein [Paracoccus aestuarii]|uniref:Glutathionylspermidine synthase family protein n=1 Tax=Paracoccus aestuarii TaxID=453842 RepID=A0A419A257_9RHOB|nr:glutathionylspermidine synthase family protein [Paracoccus aestuarii]RJL07137.1 glutathionylspermidine synthase family protein [Paracoccus aestuarii]WCQ99546.1 glutathionylspermidine synthase family protein [Paracoccus aestuarii]